MSLLFLLGFGELVWGQTQTVTITQTGSGSFTVPCGVTQMTVEVWGGGGSGGTRTTNGSGGGGGGGAYSSITITGAGGNTYDYSVGLGATSGNANPGGDTWFNTSTFVMAKGGGSVANNTTAGATGGEAAQGYGTTKINGLNGATALTTSGGKGGDGGGTGGGAGGTGRSGTQGNGSAGSAPGGGGGGAYRTSSNTRNGGAGGDGRIVITYNGYCTPSSFSGGVRPITNVTFGNINNTTSTSTSSPDYEVFCSLNNTVTQGNTYPISISRSDNSLYKVYVYIDWNQDGIFGDNPNELTVIRNSNGTGVYTANGNIAVPSSASLGNTMMRVIHFYNDITSPCNMGNNNYGQVEDYPITVLSPASITTDAISGSPFCAGSSITVPFTSTGTFNSGNTYTAQLSDASSSFASPTTIGTLTSNSSGSLSITGTIPVGTTAGNAYRVRVISSNPAVTGSNNGSNITINTVPAQPGNFTTGNLSVCAGSTQTYTVPNVTGVTYTWNVPGDWTIASGQGTNTVTYNVGTGTQTISVTPSNTCGNGTAQTLAVTVTSGVPAQPSAISGNASVCEGSTGLTYSIAAVTGAASYNWTVPTEWTITNGNGTTTITVNAGSNGGNITVTPVNGCGNGDPQTLPVILNPLPATPTATGGANCGQGQVTLTATAPSGVDFKWYSVAIGGTLLASGASYTTPTISTTTTYYVEAENSNGCVSARTSVTATINDKPNVTVTSQPSGSNLCVNSNMTYTTETAMSNYIWTFPGTAGVDYTIVSGGTLSSNTVTLQWLTSGSKSISVNYTDANGCTADNPKSSSTVNINPATIIITQPVSTASICAQSSQVLSVSATGVGLSYQWQYSTNGTTGWSNVNNNPANMSYSGGTTVNLTVSANQNKTTGTYYYRAVVNGTCGSVNSDPVTFTVNALPTISNVTGETTICNNTSTTLTANSSASGATFNWYSASSGGTLVYTGNPFMTSILNSNTNYWVAVTDENGCTSANRSPVSITVNTPPTITSQPADRTICENSSTSFSVNATGTSVGYQWQVSTDNGSNWSNLNNTNGYTGATSATLNLSSVGLERNGYKYRVILSVSSCSSVTSNEATLTVNAIPQITDITGIDEICAGTKTTLTATSNDNNATITWYSALTGGTNLGSNAAYTTPNLNNTTTYYVAATSNGCTTSPRESKTVNVVQNPDKPTITASATEICVGSVVTLFSGGTTSGSQTFNSSGSTNIPNNNSTGTYSRISVSGIPAGAVITRIAVTLNITEGNNRDLIINLKSPNNNRTLNLVNGTARGSNFNNILISSNGNRNISSDNTPSSSYNYRADGANNANAGSAGGGSTSNTTSFAGLIENLSNPNQDWQLNLRDTRSNGGNGTLNSWSITFEYFDPNAPVNVTWSPETDLFLDYYGNTPYTPGLSVATVYHIPSTAGNKTYTATASNATGCTNSSNISINAIPVVTGTLTASKTDICVGESITFTAPTANAYTFYVDGEPVQGPSNAGTFSTSDLEVGVHQITVAVANAANCGTVVGPVTVTVYELPVPVLSADKTQICQGDEVTFTATGGASYTFRVNGNPVENNDTGVFTSTTLNNNDVVTVEVTNASGCKAISDEITMTVNVLPTGTLTSTPNPAIVCEGEPITFTATPLTGALYEFFASRVSLGAASANNVFSSASLTNGQIITVTVTNNMSGCGQTLNAIPVTIKPKPTGTFTVTENSGTPNDNIICSGSTVTFSAPAGYADYTFYLNGTGTAINNGNNPVYSTTSLNNGDFFKVVVTDSSSCTAEFTSQPITVNDIPVGTLSISPSNIICAGDQVTFTATSGATKYEFKIGNTIVKTGAENTFITTSLQNGDVVTVIVTNANGCSSTYGPITMTVNPLPTGTLVPVETSGLQNDDGVICEGATVSFTASTGFDNYNFLLNGISVQSNNSNVYTNSSLTNGDKVTVAVTNGSGCIALLNEITIIVDPLPVVAAITGPDEVCVGETITLADATSDGIWTSSDPATATIDGTGLVNGIKDGTVTITYTVTNANNCSQSATQSITVHALPVIQPITGTTDVCVNGTTQLSTGTIGGTWSVDDEDIATIDQSGNVTGHKDGVVTVTYTVTNNNGCTDFVTTTVNVHDLPVVDEITGDDKVCIGGTTNLANNTPGGVWSSIGNIGSASVNSSGEVTGINLGSVTIVYTVTNAYGCVTAVSHGMTVNPLPTPTLSGKNVICPGEEIEYTTEAGKADYQWTVTGGTVINFNGSDLSHSNVIKVEWGTSGNRSVYVNWTDPLTGCSGANFVTVQGGAPSQPTLVSGPDITCLNNTDEFETQGTKEDYVWSVTGGTIVSGQGTNMITVTWSSVGAHIVSFNYAEPGGCNAAAPSQHPVTVKQVPEATITIGTSGATEVTEVCQNDAQPIITFTGSNGTAPYIFTYTKDGGVTFETATSTGNTATVSAPTNNTGTFKYTLISVKDADPNSCEQNQTGEVEVIVNELPEGTIAVDETEVCKDDTQSPQITFEGTVGTAPFTFYYKINGGSTQSVSTTTGNTVTFGVPTDVDGTFTYSLEQVKDDKGCINNQSGSVTITVNPLPGASISASVTEVCQNDEQQPLITFTGSNGTAPYTFTYQVNGGAPVTVPSLGNSNTVTVSVETDIAGSFTYELISVQDASATACSNTAGGNVTVTVSPLSVGGTLSLGTGSATVCSGTNSGSVELTGQTGNVIRWESSVDNGTNWTVINETATTHTFTNLTQTTLFRAVVQSGSCSTANSDEFTINVDVQSVGGTVNSNTTVCYGSDGSVSLSGNTGDIIRWESSVDNGGTWTAIDGTTPTHSFTNITQNTQFRAIIKNGTCGEVNSIPATITVNPLPTGSISGTTTVCIGGTEPQITFTGANGTAPYTFTYTINGGAQQTVTSTGNTATVNASTGATGTFVYTLVKVKDASSTACENTASESATITVSGLPEAPTITPATSQICLGTVVPLMAAASTTNGSVSGSNNNSYSFENNNPTGAASTINISALPAWATVTKIEVKFSITHTYVGDLVINLKSPDNNVLSLVNRRGSSGDNFTNTTITSDNTAPSITTGSAPFTGTYKSYYGTEIVGATAVPGDNTSNVTDFSQMFGTPQGNWILSVRDVQNHYGTTEPNKTNHKINNWSITIYYTVPGDPQDVKWSPETDLYTDAAATLPYTGDARSVVYAKPSAAGSVIYTATAENAAGCTNSSTTSITVNAAPQLNIIPDYCSVPNKVLLTANVTPANSALLWSNGKTTDTIQVDIADQYFVTATNTTTGCNVTASVSVAQELVVNGDFEQGNVGFTSDYAYHADVPGLVPADQGELYYDGENNGYSIVDNGQNVHRNFWGKDHTSGNGQFMIVNGHGDSLIVWKQTVNVLPNTKYYFSAWAMSVNNEGPFAHLQFQVNDSLVGTTAVLDGHGQSNNAQDNWTRFYGDWTSDANTTTAEIYIVNLEDALGGNDFALDDISFGTLSTFVRLESAQGTDAQTICLNTPLTPIRYSLGSSAVPPIVTPSLPSGITGTFDGQFYTIAGTPTAVGEFAFNITTTVSGGCKPSTATGTIKVQRQLINLAQGNNASPTLCKESPVNISFTLGGVATGATVEGLPEGLSGSVSGSTFTISGTPSANAVVKQYPYTITTSGDCEEAKATFTGTITLQEQSITLNTANSNNQSDICIKTPIQNITYNLGGNATGATITGLPQGVNYSVDAGLLIISGSPTESGSKDYLVTTSGTCTAATAAGTIQVNPSATLSLITDTPVLDACLNMPINGNIQYALTNATNASVSGLPAGLSGTVSNGIFVIDGTPTSGGSYPYSINTSGGCGTASASGTIIVNEQKLELTLGNSSPTVCENAPMDIIEYTFGGVATSVTVSDLPAGVGFTTNSNVVTISGTPTASAGSYTYHITTAGTGSCSSTALSGVVTISSAPRGGTLPANSLVCGDGSVSITLQNSYGSITNWQSSTDGGNNWDDIANNSITLTRSNLVKPTIFRAVVANGCGSITSTASSISIRNYWTGATSDDWNTASNWSDNNVASLNNNGCYDVYIPKQTYQPILSSGTVSIGNLHILSDAGATVNGSGWIKIAGDIDNTGEGLNVTDDGHVEFNGTSAQTISSSNFKDTTISNMVVSNPSVLTVSNSGNSLAITNTITFGSPDGKLNSGDNITLKSTKERTASLGEVGSNNTVTGKFTVERYINTGASAGGHEKKWIFLATPTGSDGNGQTIRNSWMEGGGNNEPAGYGIMLSGPEGTPAWDRPSPAPSIKEYNPVTDLWRGASSSDIKLYNPKGWMTFVRGDRKVVDTYDPATPTTLRSKGNLTTGPVNFTIPSGEGMFYSIGNPYASAVDMRKVKDENDSIFQNFTVWDTDSTGIYGLGAYVEFTYMGTDYLKVPEEDFTGNNNYLLSGQAIFVHRDTDEKTMKFIESAKGETSLNTTFFRPFGQETVATPMLRSNIYNDLGLIDGTLHIFGEDFSNKVDYQDARKMFNSGLNLSILVDNKSLVVERRKPFNLEDTIFYSLTGATAGKYEFAFEPNNLATPGLEAWLVDAFTKERTPVSLETPTRINFEVTSAAGSKAADRFMVVFKTVPQPASFLSIEAVKDEAKVDVKWSVNREINVDKYVVMVSTDGTTFTDLTEVKADGTDSYKIVHNNPVEGYNYYRVRSMDIFGVASYSGIASIFMGSREPLIRVFPNPVVNGMIQLQLKNYPSGKYQARLINPIGQVMLVRRFDVSGINHIEKIPWNYKMAHGNYHLEIRQPDGTIKIIVVMY